jgi:mitochondrial fission protein ELM1
MVIWRIYDGKPGHDNQSRGLVNALHRLGNCSSHDIAANKLSFGLFHYLTNKFPPGDHLPRPDLIIGAGHGTHMPVMCATHVYGGKSVVIMQPGLPVSWFDFCLAPDHDQPAPVGNVIITRGAINTVRPSSEHDDKTGLILVGGPSRHFSWNEQELLDQIRTILIRDNSVTWRISDSPRTPHATSDALSQLDFSHMTFHSWQHTGTEWVAAQLARAGRVWVSSDSMSMIYEALTSGAATGVLSVPVKKAGRLARAIKTLAAEGFVTAFPDWSNGKSLSPPPVVIDEATRCAALLLKNIEQGQYQHDK